LPLEIRRAIKWIHYYGTGGTFARAFAFAGKPNIEEFIREQFRGDSFESLGPGTDRWKEHIMMTPVSWSEPSEQAMVGIPMIFMISPGICL